MTTDMPAERGGVATFVTAQELATMLRRSVTTIYRMTQRNEIPFLKVGREYLYEPEKVIAKLSAPAPSWAQSNRSKSRRRVA